MKGYYQAFESRKQDPPPHERGIYYVCFYNNPGLLPMLETGKTGRNSAHLCISRRVTVKDLQCFFDYTTPQAIYTGRSFSILENLIILSGPS